MVYLPLAATMFCLPCSVEAGRFAPFCRLVGQIRFKDVVGLGGGGAGVGVGGWDLFFGTPTRVLRDLHVVLSFFFSDAGRDRLQVLPRQRGSCLLFLAL